MNLYMTLAPTRSLQILAENGWPATVVVQPDEHCYCFSISGHLTPESIVALLPAIASRGHLDNSSVRNLQRMTADLAMRATITGQILKGEPVINVNIESGEYAENGLCEGLQADLMVLCRQIFSEAGIIFDMTGARFEGINIFERQTRNFLIVAEAWNDMPPAMKADPGQQQLWLSEILQHGSTVVAVGLAVFREFGMIREGECHAGICIIRPGAPVRRWFPRKELHALASDVRWQIIQDRKITSSFA